MSSASSPCILPALLILLSGHYVRLLQGPRGAGARGALPATVKGDFHGLVGVSEDRIVKRAGSGGQMALSALPGLILAKLGGPGQVSSSA